MKFEFVAKHRGAWPVNLLCEALGVSRSGFYAWLVRPPSCRSQADEVLGAQVRQSFIGSDRTYGARRVWHDVLAQDQHCGLHRIERLMRLQGLRARPRRRSLPKDQGVRSAIADNVLDRQFQADAPNQKWVADFTYIWTAEGWLYAAAVLDLYSRRRGLVDARQHDLAARGRRIDDGCVETRKARAVAASLGPRQPIHQRALPGVAAGTGHHLQYEPGR